MIRLGGVMLVAWMVACGGSQPAAEEPVAEEPVAAAPPMSEPPPAPVKVVAPRDVVTVLKMCLSAAGSVDHVAVLKSSGYAAYDQLLKPTIERTWKYRPFQINGKAVPVCASVTFIYNQRNTDPDAVPEPPR